MSRLTYYKIENDKIITKRFTDPPEGWTRNKTSLEIHLRAKQIPSVTIQSLIEKEETEDELEILRSKVETLQTELLRQQKEIEVLNERLEKDPIATRNKEEDRRTKRSLELERLAVFAKNNCGISEEEHYKLKNVAQGLKQQLELQTEQANQAREAMIEYRRARSQMKEKLDKAEELAIVFYSVILRFSDVVEELINSSLLPEEKINTLNRKLAILLGKTQQGIKKAEWQKPEIPISIRFH